MSAHSLASSSFMSATSLPSPDPPLCILQWGGLLHLSDDIALYLSDDEALGHMAQACRAFACAVYKVRYRQLHLTGENSNEWTVRVHEFVAQHNNHPWGFQFVHELTIELSSWHRTSLEFLIQLIQPMLTGVHTIHIFGYESLHPSNSKWLTSLLKVTEPTTISFNGSIIPNYVLEFNIPSIRFVEFNSCRIFYPNADWEELDRREDMIDAHLVLAKGGSGWSRVESVTSGAINAETLRLLQRSCALPFLNLRLIFHQCDTEVQLSNSISAIQHLTIQVPDTAVEAVPSFFRKNLPAALSLRTLEIVYEAEFDDISTPYLILDHITPTLLAAAKRIPHCRLRCISFRFRVPENLLQIGVIDCKVSARAIRIVAMNEAQQPLRLPIALPDHFYIPFMWRTQGGDKSWNDAWMEGVPWGNTTL